MLKALGSLGFALDLWASLGFALGLWALSLVSCVFLLSKSSPCPGAWAYLVCALQNMSECDKFLFTVA